MIVEVGGSVDLWQVQWVRAYGNDGGGTGFRITVAPEAGIVAALPSTVATLGSSQTVDGLAGIAIALTTSMLPVPDMRLRFPWASVYHEADPDRASYREDLFVRLEVIDGMERCRSDTVS